MDPIPLIANDALLTWVETLTGLDKGRICESARRVADWDIRSLNQELLAVPNLDNAVAVFRLSEAFESLRAAGVPESKLLAKLRRDREVWPTWAELRAAALLLRLTAARISLDLGTGLGKHTDFTISVERGPAVPIEFKAISLSDEEREFCRRIKGALDGLLPSRGFITLHAPLDVAPISPDTLLQIRAAAASSIPELATHLQGLAGVTIVGHGGEANYARRLGLRLINEVASQIPANRQGWAAFYWTNGAPITAVLESLRQIGFPKGLAGIILLGDCLAFPDPILHSFTSVVAASAFDADHVSRLAIRSETDNAFAGNVLRRFEDSSGVRATLLCATEGEARIELCRRDGQQRILPFNLLVDSDPPVGPSRRASETPEEINDPVSVTSLTRSMFGIPGDAGSKG
jgi:hypothetical protein